MKLLTYGTMILFASPILLLFGYLFKGLYFNVEILHYFTRDTFIVALKQSLTLSSLSALLALIISVVLAKGFFTLEKNPLKLLYLLILTILFMIQPIMLLTIVKQLYIFNTFDVLWQSVIIATLHLIPLATLFWIYIYRYIYTESLHIARYLSSSWATYWYILFPQLRNKVLFAFLFLFILIFIDQEIPSILGYRTYTEELVSQITLMEEMQTIVLSALPSFIIVGCIAVAGIMLFKKNSLLDHNNNTPKKESSALLGKVILLAFFVYLGGILVVLLEASFTDSLSSLVDNNGEVILQTLLFAFAVSAFTLLLGIVFQKMFHLYASKTISILWVTLLLFYLLLPHALISLSILDIYQKIGYFSTEGDFLLFFLGYVFVLLPIVFLLLYLFDSREREEHFLSFFPVSTYNRLIKIILPRQWIPWMITFLILMIFTLNELSVSILLVPPGFETIVVKVYNLLHYGDKANIAFLSLIQLLFLIGCFTILSVLTKKVFK